MTELNPALEVLDGYDLRNLAKCNPDCREEYRRRNCAHRFDDNPPKDCECWACEQYGVSAYANFLCHPDGDYGQLLDGKCWCWQCTMARKNKND